MFKRWKKKLVYKRTRLLGAHKCFYKGATYRIEIGQRIHGLPWVPTWVFKVGDHQTLYRVTGPGLRSNVFFDPELIRKEGLTAARIVEIAIQMDEYLCAMSKPPTA